MQCGLCVSVRPNRKPYNTADRCALWDGDSNGPEGGTTIWWGRISLRKGALGVVGQINDDDGLKHNTAVVHKRRKVEVDNVLRNGLFDALHRQSGTHYGKLFSRVTLDSSL